MRKADLPGASWQVESTNFNQANPACVVKRYSLSSLTATGPRGVKYSVRLSGSNDVKSIHYVFLTVQRGRALATLGLVRYNAGWPNSFVRPLAAVMAERMTRP